MDTLNYIRDKYQIGDKGVIEVPDVDRVDLARLFGELGFKVGAEIGVECGLYSKVLLESCHAHLFSVDPWKAYKGYREHVSQEKLDGFYQKTKQYLSMYSGRNTIVRKFSNEAAKDFGDGTLDFVYIDGNHEFRHVVNDIADWYPKLRKGGILAGHDYIRRKNADYLMGVIPAVNGYCDAYNISPIIIFGRKAVIEGEKRDRTRSWLIVKQ